MGAACVKPIQHDGNHQSKPYQVQPLRNNGKTPSSSGSGNRNQNSSLTQDGKFVGRLNLEGGRNQNVKIESIQEQQLKQQQQQVLKQQQQREQELQQQQQRERERQQEQQRELEQQQQREREQQEQLQLQQQQQLEQEQQEQQEQQRLQRQQEQEQQPLQQNQPQQVQPVTDAGSLTQTHEPSHNLKSTTDTVPATDCLNETKVESPKELKRCDSLIDDDNYCPTCFYAYEIDNPKIPTKCHHHYHLACILEWMERSNSCPKCGQEMVFLEI